MPHLRRVHHIGLSLHHFKVPGPIILQNPALLCDSVKLDTVIKVALDAYQLHPLCPPSAVEGSLVYY